MLYREIIAVCSQIHTKHISTLCGQNVEFVCVKPHGIYSYHWDFKVLTNCIRVRLHKLLVAHHQVITSTFSNALRRCYNKTLTTNTVHFNVHCVGCLYIMYHVACWCFTPSTCWPLTQPTSRSTIPCRLSDIASQPPCTSSGRLLQTQPEDAPCRSHTGRLNTA